MTAAGWKQEHMAGIAEAACRRAREAELAKRHAVAVERYCECRRRAQACDVDASDYALHTAKPRYEAWAELARMELESTAEQLHLLRALR